MKLSAVVHREGRWFVAWCPEIDVASQGKTVEESLKNLREALELMKQHGFSGLPVVENPGTPGKPVGILTSRDVRFETNLDQPVSAVMTKDVITVPQGVAPDKARQILHQHRIEKLLVVDPSGNLLGLITVKDILKSDIYPDANKDADGRLRVGAAVGTSPDTLERVAALEAQVQGQSQHTIPERLAALEATAVRKGDEYVLNGTKTFVTNGKHADVFLLFARSTLRYMELLARRDGRLTARHQ